MALLEQGRVVVFKAGRERILYAQFLPERLHVQKESESYKPSSKPASRPLYKVLQLETRLPSINAVSVLFSVDLMEASDFIDYFQRALCSQTLLDCCDETRGHGRIPRKRIRQEAIEEKSWNPLPQHQLAA